MLWFKAPNSFTGEDVVEIQCTGSEVLTSRILKDLQDTGLRPAGPGEFSYRAVINGRMTLEQAERLNASINAHTVREVEIIESTPSLEPKLRTIMSMALEVLRDLEADIEFQEHSSPALETLTSEIGRLATQGRLTEKASRVPLVLLYGPPNCGKSTLFNAMLGFERAIVSPVPGTTRDYIEAELTHRGTSFRLVDTAGTRSTTDTIEARGVDMTMRLLRDADIIVSFVPSEDSRAINITAKTDTGITPAPGTLPVSSLTGEGVSLLMDTITERLEQSLYRRWDTWIPARALVLLEELEGITAKAMSEDLPELVSMHIMDLVERIRSWLEAPPIDLYGEIFSKFCIGK